MWIVPKNYLPSSVSALATVASSEDLSLPGLSIESSLMWRSKPSLLRTWLQRWKRDKWFRHLCGRILKPCQYTAFETELMSSLAVTPANHLARLESGEAQTIPDTFGLTSNDISTQLDLFGASLRTSRDTSVSDSERSLETWKALVTQRRGEYSARLKQAHLTRESGSTYWVTPTATDGNPIRGGELYQTKNGTVRAKNKDGTTSQRGLIEQVMWPTPTINGNHNRKGLSKTSGDGLSTAAKQWPTPTAHNSKEGAYPSEYNRNTPSLTSVATQEDNKPPQSGSLNPTWVEWLMGVSSGWTDLGCWGTE